MPRTKRGGRSTPTACCCPWCSTLFSVSPRPPPARPSILSRSYPDGVGLVRVPAVVVVAEAQVGVGRRRPCVAMGLLYRPLHAVLPRPRLRLPPAVTPPRLARQRLGRAGARLRRRRRRGLLRLPADRGGALGTLQPRRLAEVLPRPKDPGVLGRYKDGRPEDLGPPSGNIRDGWLGSASAASIPGPPWDRRRWRCRRAARRGRGPPSPGR